MGFPGGSEGEGSECNVGDTGSKCDIFSIFSTLCFSKQIGQDLPDPGSRDWVPTIFLSGEFNGQRSLAGYSPWGLKKLDMTNTTHISIYVAYALSSSHVIFSLFSVLYVSQSKLVDLKSISVFHSIW